MTARASHARIRRMQSAARLYAVQALFEMEIAGHDIDQVHSSFEHSRFGADYDIGVMEKCHVATFRGLLEGVVRHQGGFVNGVLDHMAREVRAETFVEA